MTNEITAAPAPDQAAQQGGMVVKASSFGDRDFSKAFESGACGEIADGYRSLTSTCTTANAERALHSEVLALQPTLDLDRVAQKILSIPVNDSLANWRAVGNGEATTDKDLKTSQIFQEAAIFARTYGCAAILPILKDSDGRIIPPSVTLETAKTRGATVDKLLLSTTNLKLGAEVETNFYKANYGWPKKLWIGNIPVHPSRVVLLGAYNKGSYFNSIRTDLADYHEAKRRLQIASRKNSAIILETNVEKIRQLLQAAQSATGATLDLNHVLKERARALFENFNDVNVGVINEGEKVHHYQQTNIKDLVLAVQLTKLILSGVADIPFSRLFGKGTSGIASNSETDFENYAQALDSFRANFIEGPLDYYDFIISELTGQAPVSYTWNDTKAEEMRLRLANAKVENNDTTTTNEG